jgi:hypothetical protein
VDLDDIFSWMDVDLSDDLEGKSNKVDSFAYFNPAERPLARRESSFKMFRVGVHGG